MCRIETSELGYSCRIRDMAANGTGAARALRGLNPVMPEAKPPAPQAVAQKQVGFGGFLKKRVIVETPTGLSYNEPRESAARRNAPRRAEMRRVAPIVRPEKSMLRPCVARPPEKKITRGGVTRSQPGHAPPKA